MTANTHSPWQFVWSPAAKITGHLLLDNFWPIFGATLLCIIRWNMLSCDITQELPALTNMHVPTLARMLNVLQLLVLDLCELLQILHFIHTA